MSFAGENFQEFRILSAIRVIFLPRKCAHNRLGTCHDVFSTSHGHAKLLRDSGLSATKARFPIPVVLPVASISSTEIATAQICVVLFRERIGWWMLPPSRWQCRICQQQSIKRFPWRLWMPSSQLKPYLSSYQLRVGLIKSRNSLNISLQKKQSW